MKKRIKKKKIIWNEKVIGTYDPNLDNLPPSEAVSRKTEEANKHLKNVKLPDLYYELNPSVKFKDGRNIIIP
jgi:hypothetical protein